MSRFFWIFPLVLVGCGSAEGSVLAPAPAPVPALAPVIAPSPGGCLTNLARTNIQPATTAAPNCNSANYDSFPDLAYATGSASHLLDLYVPRNATAPLPVVIWVHGGGWGSGSKADFAQAKRLLCRGYAVASINYRLSGEAKFPAQIYDVKAAIRYVRANAATYHIDPARIAVFGSSAGAHLASLAGLSEPDLEDLTMGNATTSSRVQAIVDLYGPVRFDQMDAQLAAQGCPASSHGSSYSPESRLLGCTVSNPACSAAVQRADPSRYANSNDPPALILHGTRDCIVPVAQSTLLNNALQAAGACSIQRAVTGAGHGGIEWISAPVQDAVKQFLDAALSSGGVMTQPVVNCAAFVVTGDPTGSRGARWSYVNTDQGVHYNLEGVLYEPPGSGPFPAVVLSHGRGGAPASYLAGVAPTMVDWGMVAIGVMYTHAAPPLDDGHEPAGGDGASTANVLRAHKARDLLSCVNTVDMQRVAAHGHSMGAFVTAELVGTYPVDFAAASHTAGGVMPGSNATHETTAQQIRTPYQIHHGDQDNTVNISADRTFDSILTTTGVTHEFYIYSGYTHRQITYDATMLARVQTWYLAHGVL